MTECSICSAAARAAWPISMALARPSALIGARGTRDSSFGLGEHEDLIAAEALGTEHRRIRVSDEVLDAHLLARSAGDAGRDGDADRLGLPDVDGLAHHEHAQLLGQRRGLIDVRLRQHEHELLAAPSPDVVDRPDVRAHQVGHPPQDDVACVVLPGVVDRT